MKLTSISSAAIVAITLAGLGPASAAVLTTESFN